MKYVSSFVISWLWPEVVRSWRWDVPWIRRRHLRQLGIRRVGRKTEFWWKFGERHDKAASLHEVEAPVRKTFFFNKMAVPYLLSGMFLFFFFFFRSKFRRWKKESIFTKEGVFGCDVFNLRFWKLRRSTLLRKAVSAAVEIRRFLRRSLIFQRQEKAGKLTSKKVILHSG